MIFQQQDLNTEILIGMCKFYAFSAQTNLQKKKTTVNLLKKYWKSDILILFFCYFLTKFIY